MDLQKMFGRKDVRMAKKLTIVQWMGACKRVIASGDCDDLKKVLEYLQQVEDIVYSQKVQKQ